MKNLWIKYRIIVIILAVVVVILIGISVYKNVIQQKNLAAAAASDSQTGKNLDQQLGLTSGRGLIITGAARGIYTEITTAHWYTGGIDNTKLYPLLNVPTNATEMQALETVYNVNISNNTHNLKSDIDSSDFFDSSKVPLYNILT